MPKALQQSRGLSPSYTTQKQHNFGIDIDRLCCSARNKNEPTSSPLTYIKRNIGNITTSIDKLNRAGIVYYEGKITGQHLTIKNKKIYEFEINKDYIQGNKSAPPEDDHTKKYLFKKEEKPDSETLTKIREIAKIAYKNEEAFRLGEKDGLLHTTRRALCVQVLAEALGVGHIFAHADIAQISKGEFGLLMPEIEGITIEEWLNQNNLIIAAADNDKKAKIEKLKEDPTRYWDSDFKNAAYKAFKEAFANHLDFKWMQAIDQLCGQIDHIKLTNIMVQPVPKTLNPVSEHCFLTAIDNDLAFPEYADDVYPILSIDTVSNTEGPALAFPQNPCCQRWVERLCELLESLYPIINLDRFKKELSAMFPKLPDQCPPTPVNASPASTGISSGRATPGSNSSPQPSTSAPVAKSVKNIPESRDLSPSKPSTSMIYLDESWSSSDLSNDEQTYETLPFTQTAATQTLDSGGFDISCLPPDALRSALSPLSTALSEAFTRPFSSQNVTPSQNLPSMGFEPLLDRQEEQSEEESFPSTSGQGEFDESSEAPPRKKSRRNSHSAP